MVTVTTATVQEELIDAPILDLLTVQKSQICFIGTGNKRVFTSSTFVLTVAPLTLVTLDGDEPDELHQLHL